MFPNLFLKLYMLLDNYIQIKIYIIGKNIFYEILQNGNSFVPNDL